MKHKISIQIESLQNKFGNIRALEITKEIGADAVDFSTFGMQQGLDAVTFSAT